MQQTIFLLRVLVTFIITIIATVQDLKSYKIKNELIIGAFVAGGNVYSIKSFKWR